MNEHIICYEVCTIRNRYIIDLLLPNWFNSNNLIPVDIRTRGKSEMVVIKYLGVSS